MKEEKVTSRVLHLSSVVNKRERERERGSGLERRVGEERNG